MRRNAGLLFANLLSLSLVLGCGLAGNLGPATIAEANNSRAIPPQSSPFQRVGTILQGAASEQYTLQEPTVLYEGDPQLISANADGNVFKLWFTCGWSRAGLCYAESQDGKTWTRDPAPVIAMGTRTSGGIIHGFVFHYNGVYYVYGAVPACCGAIGYYTSPDGINWTLAHENVIPTGTSKQWDHELGNMYIVPSSGKWLALYEGGGPPNDLYFTGVATSNDQGVTWTKYSGNPVLKSVINGAFGGPEIHLINGTYYLWAQCNVTSNGHLDNEPSDICQAHSDDFFHWQFDSGGQHVFVRQTPDEGPNSAGGQVADPSMVEVNGSTYIFYDATSSQLGTSSEPGKSLHLKLAIFPGTLEQLAQSF